MNFNTVAPEMYDTTPAFIAARAVEVAETLISIGEEVENSGFLLEGIALNFDDGHMADLAKRMENALYFINKLVNAASHEAAGRKEYGPNW
jgi:hypothetical protein